MGEQLSPAANRVLADWYLAVNRRADHERAVQRIYDSEEEWRLQQLINQELNVYRNRQMGAGEMKQDVLMAFRSLFERSAQPQNYLGLLQIFYQSSHDFRLLSMLSDSLVGHTAGKVYPFLQGMQGVLNEIRDEATADQLREQIAKTRLKAKTAVDQRALDLLEMQVARRAAEVQNQSGPHAATALAALQRVTKREWGPGEQRLMADLLANLGTIAVKPLADEQFRICIALFEAQPRQSFDRLHVATDLSRIHAAYGRLSEAIALLRGELADFEAANDGALPVSANSALQQLIGYEGQQRHYREAEKLVMAQLEHPIHGQQKLWLSERLFEIYLWALENDGEVSLGSRETLYSEFERRLLAALETPDHNYRYQVVDRLCSLYRTAHQKKLPGVGTALLNFSSKVLPRVLESQTNNYMSIVDRVAQTIREVVGVREALALLITRFEQEPIWLRLTNQGGWPYYAERFTQWRFELKTLGDLEPRLLKIVLAELRRELVTREIRHRTIYYGIHDQRFWIEKIGDFVRVAEEVYAERKNSSDSLFFVADYLYYGLDRWERAIEMLFIAHREERLNQNGVAKLVAWLHQRNRFGESIALLNSLITSFPEDVVYRVSLMHAYHETKLPAEVLRVLAETERHFHEGNRWSDHVLASLGNICLKTRLYEQSVKYFEELVARINNGRTATVGVDAGPLFSHYTGLAEAYAGLKQTDKAVDAASAATIHWQRHQQSRQQALETLKSVLRQSTDLDGYVKLLDEKTAAEKQERPIVRKSLGEVYLERRELTKAAEQFRKALEFEPNDLATHKALIQCYEELSDRKSAAAAILDLLEINRRELELYKKLADHFTALELPGESERAYTSLVEADPHEAENHSRLADIRETQNRWPEAIEQWRQVARIRELEPQGLLRLARANIHEKQYDAARDYLKQLDAKSWPPHLGDVPSQTRQMREEIDAATRK